MLVELSARAEADYLAIVEFLAEYSARSAMSFIEAFERTQEELRDFPNLGVVRSHPYGRVLHFGRRYHLEYDVLPARLIVRRVKDGRRSNV